MNPMTPYLHRNVRIVRTYNGWRGDANGGKVYFWCKETGDYRWLWEGAVGINTRSYLQLAATLHDLRIAKETKRNFLHTMRYLRRVCGIRRHP